MKKITMKEIAALANVSIATVSYVLNNVGNQTIPEKTRRHIEQIAKENNYIPNLAARSLKKKTGMVGILVCRREDDPWWRQQSHSWFIHRLEQRLTANGYHALLYSVNADSPSIEVIVQRQLEAVFLIDAKEEAFHGISAHFREGVPLVVIDSLIEDPLFNQVVFDYAGAVRAAERMLGSDDYCLILDKPNNGAINRLLIETANRPDGQICIAGNEASLLSFLRRAQPNRAIVASEFIAKLIENSGYQWDTVALCTSQMPGVLASGAKAITFEDNKAEKAFQLMLRLLDRTYGERENITLIKAN